MVYPLTVYPRAHRRQGATEQGAMVYHRQIVEVGSCHPVMDGHQACYRLAVRVAGGHPARCSEPPCALIHVVLPKAIVGSGARVYHLIAYRYARRMRVERVMVDLHAFHPRFATT